MNFSGPVNKCLILIVTSLFVGVKPFDSLAQEQVIIPSTGQEAAAFGYSITHNNEWLLVGAKNDSTISGRTGAAYFFKLENAKWVEKQKVFSDNGAIGDLFGISVSMSGDYAVVTANGDDTQGLNTGAAFVYKKEGDTWIFKQKLLPHSGINISEYGIGVSLVDKLMVVGAYSDNENGQFSGAAYIYSLSGDVWVEVAKILPEDGAPDDKFGRSVNTDGKKVIVCGVLNDDLGVNSGSAYIFASTNGNWYQEEKLLAPDGAENDRFGRSVAIDGEYAAIGSVLDDDNGECSGSVYIFHKEHEGWKSQSKFTPKDGEAGDFFGYCLAMNGRYLIVGAHNNDDYGLNSGSAYLFTRLGITWSETEKISPENLIEGANFAESVNIDDSWISFGSPYYQNASAQTGAAFMYSAPKPLSISSEQNSIIKIYPNPVQEHLFIEFIEIPMEVKIHNTMGKTLIDLPNIGLSTSQNFQIDVSDFDQGIYIINVMMGSGRETFKFIKL